MLPTAASGRSSRCGPPRPLRVDVHTHILPESWPDLRARYGYPGFVQLQHTCAGKAVMMHDDGRPFREVEDNLWSLERRARDMDATGVDVHVLSTVPVMFNYGIRPDDALDLCQMLNNHVSACVAHNPRRFAGLGSLPLQSPELACQELRRCVAALGLVGVQVGTHAHGTSLADASLLPVWRLAEELGAAVFVHPWDMPAASHGGFFLPWLTGMPYESASAICEFMFAGVFERLPALRVCFAHGGGALPCTIGRIQHGFDVRPDLCAAACKTPPRAQMGRFWADSLVHDADALDGIVRLYGRERVCLGTDYPFPLGEYTAASGGRDYAAGALVDSMAAWDDGLRAAVLGGNACAWMGREAGSFLR